MFFGLGKRGALQGVGCTNLSIADAKERISNLRESQWGMCLIHNAFGSDSDERVELERGDVYRVVRAGDLAESSDKVSSRERTTRLFTVEVALGVHRVTLMPHEISPITFLRIMDLKKAGEIEESYLSPGDAEGFFMPTPEAARKIERAFGGRHL